MIPFIKKIKIYDLLYNDRKQIRLVAAWKLRMLEGAQRRGYKRKLLRVMNMFAF